MRRFTVPAILSASIVAALPLPAKAATYVWDTNTVTAGAQDGAGTWTKNAPNWFDQTDSLQNVNWADGSDAVFGAGSGAAGTVTLGGPITANSLTFNAAGSGSYTLTGNTLTNSTGNITLAASVSATINSILGGAVGLTENGSSVVATVSTLTLGGAVANTYTGVTTLTGGSLNLAKTGGAIAVQGDILVNGGTLAALADNEIANTSSMTVSSGAVGFGGHSQTMAALTMSGGAFGTGNSGGASTVTVTGTMGLSGAAGVTLNSGATMSAGTITMAGTSNILLGGNAFTKLVVGSGGLSMASETITMNAGTASNQIALNGDVTASGTSSIVIGTPGSAGVGTINELAMGSATRTFNIAGSLGIGVIVSGSGGNLIKTGVGTLTFSGGGANTYSGLTTVSAGILSLGKTVGVNAIAGDVLINGGTLSLAGSDQIADTANMTISSGAFNLTGKNETIQSLTMSGGTLANTSGTATISGNLTVTGGAVTSTTGTVKVGGSVVASGGSITNTSGNMTVTGGMTLAGATFGSGSGTTTVNGDVVVSGALPTAFTVNSGGVVSVAGLSDLGGGLLLGGSSAHLTTLTIGADGLSLTGQTVQTNGATAGFAGTQIFLNGDLSASGINAFTISGTQASGSVDQLVIGAATRNFNITTLGQTNVSLSVTGTGGNLVKQGGGTLALLAGNSYSGTTTVAGGTLAISSLGDGLQGTLAGTSAVVVTGAGNLQDGSSVMSTNNGIIDRINPAAPLTLGGSLGSGTFTQAFGATGSSTSQTLASLAVQQGANTISTLNPAVGTVALIFTGTAGGGGYARSVGSSVNVIPATGFTVSLPNAPTAAGGSTVSGTGADAILTGATLNSTDFVAAQAGNLTAATYTATGTSTWTAGKNMDVTGSVAATAGMQVNSLRFGTAGAFTVSISGTQSIASGAILVNGNVGANLSTITGGILTGSLGGDLLVLQDNSAAGLTIASTIADNGGATALTIAGAVLAGANSGLVTLTGTNTYTGPTYLNTGAVLSIAGNGALGDAATGAALNIDGGTLLPTASFALDNAGANARNVVLGGGGGTFNTNTGISLTLDGAISGNGMLTKSGSGTLLLTGANSFSGGSTLGAGILQIGSNTALGTGTAFLGSVTLQPVGAARTLSNAFNLQGAVVVSGGFGLTINGVTTMSVTAGSIANNLTGGNSLTLAGNVFLSTGVISVARQLTVTGTGSTLISGAVAGNDGGRAAVAGITWNGLGSLELTGVNSYQGRTITAGGGALIVHQDVNFGAVPAMPMTDAVIIAQNGLLEVANSFTLNSNRNIGIGSSAGGPITGTVQVQPGQTFTVGGVVADRTENSDGSSIGVTTTGSLAKTGTGTLVLAGQNTYSGNTTVSAGTLIVSGSIAASASGTSPAVSVAGGATLSLSGAGAISASTLSLSNNSTLSLEVGSLTSNTISLTGAATLAGTVTLALNLTADPVDGTVFTLVSGGGNLSGYAGGARFAVNGTSVNDGGLFTVTTGSFTQQFQLNYNGSSSNVTVLAVPEPKEWAMLVGIAGWLLGVSRFRRRRALFPREATE